MGETYEVGKAPWETSTEPVKIEPTKKETYSVGEAPWEIKQTDKEKFMAPFEQKAKEEYEAGQKAPEKLASGLDYPRGNLAMQLYKNTIFKKDGTPVVTQEDLDNAAKGKAPSSYSILRRAGANKVTAGIAGTMADMVLDPIMYAGEAASLVNKAGKYVKTMASISPEVKAAKLAGLTPEAINAGIGVTEEGKQGILAAEKAGIRPEAIAQGTRVGESTEIPKATEASSAFAKSREEPLKLSQQIYENIPKQESPITLAGQFERTGQHAQVGATSAIDYALKGEKAEPLSNLIREHKLSGKPELLAQELNDLATKNIEVLHGTQDEDGLQKTLGIFDAPEARNVPVVNAENIFTNVKTRLQKAVDTVGAKTTLGADAQAALSEIEKIETEIAGKGRALTLEEARIYNTQMGKVIPEGAFKELSKHNNGELINAVKEAAYKLRGETEKGFEKAFSSGYSMPVEGGQDKVMTGKELADYVRKINKELQTKIAVEGYLSRAAGKEAGAPFITGLEAIMAGFGVGRAMAGSHVAPMAAALTAEMLKKYMSTPAFKINAGRNMEWLGTNPVTKRIINKTAYRGTVETTRKGPQEK